MAAGRCRDSPTGWTSGSSSSSIWRSSWSSTCCPEGAGPRATLITGCTLWKQAVEEKDHLCSINNWERDSTCISARNI